MERGKILLWRLLFLWLTTCILTPGSTRIWHELGKAIWESLWLFWWPSTWLVDHRHWPHQVHFRQGLWPLCRSQSKALLINIFDVVIHIFAEWFSDYWIQDQNYSQMDDGYAGSGVERRPFLGYSSFHHSKNKAGKVLVQLPSFNIVQLTQQVLSICVSIRCRL